MSNMKSLGLAGWEFDPGRQLRSVYFSLLFSTIIGALLLFAAAPDQSMPRTSDVRSGAGAGTARVGLGF